MAEVTDGLRERLEAALRTTPARGAATTLIDHTEHRYNAGCALCRSETDTLADALLPVIGSILQEQGARLVEAEAELGVTRRARDTWRRKALEIEQVRDRLSGRVAQLEAELKLADKSWDRLATERDNVASEKTELGDQLLRVESAARLKQQDQRQRAEDAEAHADRLAAEVDRLKMLVAESGAPGDERAQQ